MLQTEAINIQFNNAFSERTQCYDWFIGRQSSNFNAALFYHLPHKQQSIIREHYRNSSDVIKITMSMKNRIANKTTVTLIFIFGIRFFHRSLSGINSKNMNSSISYLIKKIKVFSVDDFRYSYINTDSSLNAQHCHDMKKCLVL